MPAPRRRNATLGALVAALTVLTTWSTAVPVRAATIALIPSPVYGQTRSLSCEAAALQMALAAKGIDVSQEWIIDAMGADRRGPGLSGRNVVHWGDPYATFVANVDGSEPGYTAYAFYHPPPALPPHRPATP